MKKSEKKENYEDSISNIRKILKNMNDKFASDDDEANFKHSVESNPLTYSIQNSDKKSIKDGEAIQSKESSTIEEDDSLEILDISVDDDIKNKFSQSDSQDESEPLIIGGKVLDEDSFIYVDREDVVQHNLEDAPFEEVFAKVDEILNGDKKEITPKEDDFNIEEIKAIFDNPDIEIKEESEFIDSAAIGTKEESELIDSAAIGTKEESKVKDLGGFGTKEESKVKDLGGFGTKEESKLKDSDDFKAIEDKSADDSKESDSNSQNIKKKHHALDFLKSKLDIKKTESSDDENSIVEDVSEESQDQEELNFIDRLKNISIKEWSLLIVGIILLAIGINFYAGNSVRIVDNVASGETAGLSIILIIVGGLCLIATLVKIFSFSRVFGNTLTEIQNIEQDSSESTNKELEEDINLINIDEED